MYYSNPRNSRKYIDMVSLQWILNIIKEEVENFFFNISLILHVCSYFTCMFISKKKFFIATTLKYQFQYNCSHFLQSQCFFLFSMFWRTKEQKYKSHNLELLMLFISLSNCTNSYFFENMKEMHLNCKIQYLLTLKILK